MILRLSLHLPEDITYIRTARLLSRCLLEDMKVDQNIISDVESIVAELCTNVIRHAHSKTSHYLMTLEYFKPKVVIMVKDEGPGFADETVRPAGTARPDFDGGERFGGFGLSLIKSLSDNVDFSATDPHGTTVCVEKYLFYETAGDAAVASARDTDDGAVIIAEIG